MSDGACVLHKDLHSYKSYSVLRLELSFRTAPKATPMIIVSPLAVMHKIESLFIQLASHLTIS